MNTQPTSQQYLRKIVHELPESLYAEIVDGEVLLSTVTRPIRDILMIEGLRRAVGEPPGLVAVRVSTVDLPATAEEYLPDLAYYRQDELDMDDWLNPATALVLAVEVISDTTPTGRAARRDRVDKARGYASSDVPLYLLIDPTLDSVTLHADPYAGRYQSIVTGPYGTPLDLPAPFDCRLDTGFLDAFRKETPSLPASGR